MSKTRTRADRLLVARGLFESRTKAQAAIAAGRVTADGARVKKGSETISTGAAIVAEPAHPYVSRGGVKLATALAHFQFDPRGKVCLDVGSSTGGFTDVLLRAGALRVYAVDVGTGQLHVSLRNRDDVVLLEKTDARKLDRSSISDPPKMIVIDVSFVSLRKILPNVTALVAPGAELVALVKPQFEAGRRRVRKGVVRDASVHLEVCEDIIAFVATLGWAMTGVTDSPILGGSGNREFLLGARLVRHAAII